MTTFYVIGWGLAAIIAVVVIAQAVSIVRDIVRERDGWQDAYNEARAMLWEAQREVQEMKAQRACAYCSRERQSIYNMHCDDCYQMLKTLDA